MSLARRLPSRFPLSLLIKSSLVRIDEVSRYVVGGFDGIARLTVPVPLHYVLAAGPELMGRKILWTTEAVLVSVRLSSQLFFKCEFRPLEPSA